jgi:hypothetical protein
MSVLSLRRMRKLSWLMRTFALQNSTDGRSYPFTAERYTLYVPEDEKIVNTGVKLFYFHRLIGTSSFCVL